MKPSAAEIREKLNQERGSIDWPFLESHARADNSILVGDDVDLLDVAVAIATDDAQTIHAYLTRGSVHKPTSSEQAALKATEGAYFEFMIVAPFVVAKRIRLDETV